MSAAAPSPDRLRAWWFHRQGLDGSLAGASPASALARSGWARSVGGAGPYLALHARTGAARDTVDAAVAEAAIHELPAARGCTYVLPARDYALGLTVGAPFAGAEQATARTLGVTDDEIARLCDAVCRALDGGALDPDAIRRAVGDAARSLGEAGRRKGLTTTLPVALGLLQARGDIRRVPATGRLDAQRFRYARWTPNPLARRDGALAPWGDEPAATALARRYFAWIGPATEAEFRTFAGLGVRAAREAIAPLGLVPAWPGSERLLLPDDVAAWEAFALPGAPCYALVSSLDTIVAARRDLAALLDPADAACPVMVDGGEARPLGGLGDLPSHAILERGRLVGLWEFDPAAGEIVWTTFAPPADASALADAVARTERYVRDELGDARAFSLDTPARRAPRVAALRSARSAAPRAAVGAGGA